MMDSTLQAQKLDGGKAPVSLVPSSGVIAVAEVLAFGAQKYSANQWRAGIEWSRLISAAFRHLLKFNEGETVDPESGLNHLAHAACNIFFLLEFMSTHPELDDRYNKPLGGFRPPLHPAEVSPAVFGSGIPGDDPNLEPTPVPGEEFNEDGGCRPDVVCVPEVSKCPRNRGLAGDYNG